VIFQLKGNNRILERQNFNPALEPIVDLSLVKDDFAITQIMPNPAINQTIVYFVSKTSEKLIMNVYDMSGRQVAQLYNAEVVSGINYNITFDTSLLESGLYNISLTSLSQVNMKRLLIAH
jgi:hypothetical protein